MAGMALLMEGSTMREGKYSQNLRKAAEWLMVRSQSNGLIGDPRNDREAGRYMYGHGYGLLFLSCVYGEEEDGEQRKKLEDILTRAVRFTGNAQSSTGGWNYISERDTGGDGHEGSVTIVQVQSLRAARNAGIVVPKEIIDKAHEYLKKSTTADGGILYRLGQGGPPRPALAAQAIACLFSAGEYTSEHAKKMLQYCVVNLPISTGNVRFGHFEYTNYYYAQVLYTLGDDGFVKLFPNSKPEERLTWSKYKAVIFDHLASSQNPDGSWSSSYIGSVYSASCYLTVLQLDKGTLPIYQR
jgi:hypothetical protein